MGIKIIDEGDIEITAGELARYCREWQKAFSYTVSPPTLEDFIRGQEAAEKGTQEFLRERAKKEATTK